VSPFPRTDPLRPCQKRTVAKSAAPGSGVRNAYTNILLAWFLRRTATLLNQLNRDDGG
jgi:hypothetical protein